MEQKKSSPLSEDDESDECFLERSEKWSTIKNNFGAKEGGVLDVRENQTGGDEIAVNNKSNNNNYESRCKALVALDTFEGSSSSTSIDEHIVQLVYQHRQVHVTSDDDSLHSLDTANYVRPRRKKKPSSRSTTTIKKFSFVKGSRKQLQKKYGKVFYKNIPRCSNYRAKEVPPKEEKKSTNLSPVTSAPAQRQCSRRMKRPSDISTRSLSNSSSSSSSPPPRYLRTKFKRSRSVKKNETGAAILSSTTEISETELKLCEKKLIPSSVIPDTEAKSSNESGFSGTSFINSTALPKINQSSMTNPTRKSLNKDYKYKLTTRHINPPVNGPSNRPSTYPIKPFKNPVSKMKTKKKAKSSDIQVNTHEVPEVSKEQVPEDHSKILLYRPTNLESHKQNISGKSFHLTREYFFETVGKKNSRRFIKLNSKKFPFKFDRESTIYFKIPEESEESASSDEDVLYMFGREGKLIVEPAACIKK